jgi:hypothetical protein
MHSHTQSYKRLKCEICNAKTITSVAKVGDDEYALALPPEWRILWSKTNQEMQFWCSECWEVFALTLEQDESPL